MKRIPISQTSNTFLALCVSLVVLTGAFNCAQAKTYNVWEKIEITLNARKSYENPYTQTEVCVDIEGPEFKKRCYGFWDGGRVFRVRILATEPGRWKWVSGSNQNDPGLKGKAGKFTATEWSEAAKLQNPCRRGMIKATANGHAFEYADDTPFFVLGDTWWSAGTFRYPWFEDDTQRPIGPKAGFKDYLRFRKAQGFNCIAIVAAFPNWANDDKPAEFDMSDGTQLRSGWPQAGTKSTKDMTDEKGNRPFFFPGKIPGYEKYFPDIHRINPAYFQSLDKKMDHLNADGFVPFIEVSRRDVGPAWHKHYPWPDSYTRYIQYIWSRYQANICLFSPIHFDSRSSLAAPHWNEAANKVIEKYGHPPFGTLAGCNPAGTSLRSFDHRTDAKWITFHQIGNSHNHKSYADLTKIFNAKPPLPAFNGEPYYAGMHGEPGGSDMSASNCRSHMYGSVLSGGLGGHIYGAGDRAPKGGAMWAGEVEDVDKPHIWDAIKWQSADQLRHLKTFIFSIGDAYQRLEPKVELLSPNKTKVEDFDGWDDCIGWAYCSRTARKDYFMIYFEKHCPRAILSGAVPKGKYKASWFDPRKSRWIDAGTVRPDEKGRIVLPKFPDNLEKTVEDWALKLEVFQI